MTTSPLAVKEGWKTVPVEPTPEMVEAGRRAIKEAPDLGGIVSENTPEAYDAYVAMLAAAPTYPNTGVPTEEEILRIIHENIWVDHETYYGATEAARAILKLLTEKAKEGDTP